MKTPVDSRPHLLIFAREPVLGRVKTRLAVGIGAAAALAVYRELLALTAAAVAAAQVPATVWLAEAPAEMTADEALPRPEWPGLPWRVQPPADSLGARMAHACGAAFGAGAGRAVIIGTDCPGLSAALLTRAFEELLTHDVVLGPADDGGYYLLGMNKLEVELFQNKSWSTATVLPDTLADTARLGLRVALLPTLHDVDSVQDLATWRAAKSQA
ncbi:TIGR04282 family arsenosugar biosynthesis glycosyltransferase [Hymenobacter psoromatis]|uniref:TIGR04282 family arsenosugar biosynthesis glycosyltransferase n=1 Tax=Hymenobacter psoromatis TaxID=1484116 RepID=UPI001CBBBB09|nr:TIGR04282 family arsenosugar biosynthesis glycosyltransferase [Hymenobacter psoromatis]